MINSPEETGLNCCLLYGYLSLRLFYISSCILTNTPNTFDCGLYLLLEAFDQFAVGVDQCLLGFDLGNDGLLDGKRWEGDFYRLENLDIDVFLGRLRSNVVEMLFLSPHDHFQETDICSRFWNQTNNTVGKAGREIKNGGVANVRGNGDHNHRRLEELA